MRRDDHASCGATARNVGVPKTVQDDKLNKNCYHLQEMIPDAFSRKTSTDAAIRRPATATDSMKPVLSPLLQYRLAVASRVLAAIGGGYTLSAVAAALLAVVLPMPPAEAVITATLLSLIVFCCAVVWVFAARTAWRAWGGILVPGVVLGAGLLVQRSMA